jgi:recombination protein RecT
MTDNKPQSKAVTPIQDFQNSLTVMRPQLEKALPAHVSVDKFERTLLTAVQKEPKLLQVQRQTLWESVVKCASDGLLPDGREAAVVIYGDRAQYMPMTAGILKKVRNSGELSSIATQVVHKNDAFKFWVDGEGEHLNHEPLDRGDALGVYALAKTKDGGVYVEFLDLKQVNDIKKMARSKNVWEGPFWAEMWKKSAIRRLSKRLPMSTDLEGVIERDDSLYEPEQTTQPTQTATTSSRLSKIVDQQTGTSDAELVSDEEVPI